MIIFRENLCNRFRLYRLSDRLRVTRADHDVLGVDVNSDLIDKLSNDGLHIVNENGLAEIAREAFSCGRLRVSRSPEPADVFILAVLTPCRRLPDSIEIGAARK